MLIGAIDFNYFILLSVTLTLLEGHKVSRDQNRLGSFSDTVVNMITMKYDMVLEQFKLNLI